MSPRTPTFWTREWSCWTQMTVTIWINTLCHQKVDRKISLQGTLTGSRSQAWSHLSNILWLSCPQLKTRCSFSGAKTRVPWAPMNRKGSGTSSISNIRVTLMATFSKPLRSTVRTPQSSWMVAWTMNLLTRRRHPSVVVGWSRSATGSKKYYKRSRRHRAHILWKLWPRTCNSQSRGSKSRPWKKDFCLLKIWDTKWRLKRLFKNREMLQPSFSPRRPSKRGQWLYTTMTRVGIRINLTKQSHYPKSLR